MRKAIIKDGIVVNTIEIDEGANWAPPKDCLLVETDTGSRGDIWDNGKFIKPEPIERELSPLEALEKRIIELENQLA